MGTTAKMLETQIGPHFPLFQRKSLTSKEESPSQSSVASKPRALPSGLTLALHPHESRAAQQVISTTIPSQKIQNGQVSVTVCTARGVARVALKSYWPPLVPSMIISIMVGLLNGSTLDQNLCLRRPQRDAK